MLIHRQEGKKWKLPDTLHFSPHGRCFYNVVYKKPLKDEYFLSGATITVYFAHHDMPQKMLVAVPTCRALTEKEYHDKHHTEEPFNQKYLVGEKIKRD